MCLVFKVHQLAQHFISHHYKYIRSHPNLLQFWFLLDLLALNKLTERIRPLCGKIAQSNDNKDCHTVTMMASSATQSPAEWLVVHSGRGTG